MCVHVYMHMSVCVYVYGGGTDLYTAKPIDNVCVRLNRQKACMYKHVDNFM